MDGRRLPNSRWLWARGNLSFDLSKELGLDFKKAFKTIIQSFGVPKWMVEATRKPQVMLGQNQSGGRCVEVSKQGGEFWSRRKGTQVLENCNIYNHVRPGRGGGWQQQKVVMVGEHVERCMWAEMWEDAHQQPCQGNTFVLWKPGFRGSADCRNRNLFPVLPIF